MTPTHASGPASASGSAATAATAGMMLMPRAFHELDPASGHWKRL